MYSHSKPSDERGQLFSTCRFGLSKVLHQHKIRAAEIDLSIYNAPPVVPCRDCRCSFYNRGLEAGYQTYGRTGWIAKLKFSGCAPFFEKIDPVFGERPPAPILERR